MEKTAVIEKIHAEIEAQYQRVLAAVEESTSYATDPDSKAESKYDTRGLEASYLAAGQAVKADELADDLRYFTAPNLPDIAVGGPIEHGALVIVELSGGESVGYLLAGRSGGTAITIDGIEVTVLTPTSPLYQSMDGLRASDELDRPVGRIASVV